MFRSLTRLLPVVSCSILALTLTTRPAAAQTTVSLPDTSQTTLLTATVSEQARVIVPASIAFSVTNIANSTAANPATVTIDRIVLATATKQLRVSVQANAASFTPPAVGAPTWSASDVTWNASIWTRATGASGVLSAVSFAPIATCDAAAADCSTTDLTFTLGAKPTVNRSGAHTLVVTWKLESIGS